MVRFRLLLGIFMLVLIVGLFGLDLLLLDQVLMRYFDVLVHIFVHVVQVFHHHGLQIDHVLERTGLIVCLIRRCQHSSYLILVLTLSFVFNICCTFFSSRLLVLLYFGLDIVQLVLRLFLRSSRTW